MDVVIFAHPDRRGSHNSAILKYVQGKLAVGGNEVQVLDLYAEKFDPILRVVEEARGDGTKYSQEMRRYQGLIARAERLVFIYPVWWYNMPAVLKGFVDRAFTAGFAYELVASGKGGAMIAPLLKGKKAVVISTFGFGNERYEWCGRAPELVLDRAVLEACGMEVTRVNWFNVRPGIGMPDDVRKRIDDALR